MLRSLSIRGRRRNQRQSDRAVGRVRVERLENRSLLAGDVLITEFMASNSSSLTDRDGDTPDWIELFNNGREPVDLRGWSLTDDANDLTKWRLPSVTLDSEQFLIVFASDKDRADEFELHTDFRLSSGGEYLAIVEPDGSTVSHEYAPQYPPQQSDVSYGLSQRSVEIDLVAPGADVRVLTPTSAAGDVATATWTSADYNDAAWATRGLGVGFDAGGELTGLISESGGIANEMQDRTASAYLRSSFEFNEDPASVDALQLDINYDDGFVAYLNGVEVASRQAPDGLRNWSSVATAEHGGAIGSFQAASFADAEVQGQMTVNGDAEFSDERLRLTQSFGDEEGSAWLTEPMPFAPDYSFSTSFAVDVHSPGNLGFLEPGDADGVGGHGLTFALQSGGPFRLGEGGGGMGLANAGMTFLAIELDTFENGAFDPDESLPTHIGIISSDGGSLARVPVPRFNGGAVNQNLRYVWVDYRGDSDALDVFFSDANSKPAAPTVSTTIDLAQLFGGVPSLWAGFTAATAVNWNAHEVLNWQLESVSNELGLLTETIDLTEHAGALRSGTNVLAVHGLNQSASDDDFLINYQFTGTLSNVPILDEPVYFTFPSPGEANGEGTEFPAPEVEYSVTGRNFAQNFDVELTSTTGVGEIRFTTDGRMPTENSQLYTGPISIDETTRIRARVFETGKGPGPIRTESYVKLSSALINFEDGVFQSNIPIIVLDSFGDGGANSDASNLHPATAVVIDVGDDGYASLLDEPDFAGPLGMRIRGQSSQGWPKRQYALEFWEDRIDFNRSVTASRGPDENVRFLGLPADSDWVLNGPYSDKTQLNNYMAFNLYRDLGLQAPRTRIVEVFANFNGGSLNYSSDYRGTYVLLEKIKLDRNRIDRPDAIPEPARDADPTTVGGFVFKQDKDGAGDVNFSTTGHGGPRIPLKFVEPESPTRAQRTWLTDFVNDFEAALYSNDFDDPETGYAKYIDVDSFIDHWLITELAKEIDGFRLSEYFFLNADGKIEKGPAWDYNLSFSNGNYLDGGQWNRWYYDGISGAQYHWYPRLFRDPNFESRLHDRWFELRQNEFAWETLEAKIDEAVTMLTNGSPNYDQPAPGEASNPISRNFDRWGTVSSYLWPNCFFGQGGNNCRSSPLPRDMSPNGQPNSYDDYIFIMKDFVSNRLNWIDDQFGKPPAFSPEGGIVSSGTRVTLTSDLPGQIFYTLDGSDPQQAGNGQLYTGPIEVTENLRIISRSFNSGRNEWSSRSQATYFVNVPPLVVTELNYNPAASSDAEIAAGFPESDSFEFFEIMNVGNQSFDLQGVTATEGVQFVFGETSLAAGEVGVVVRDADAFQLRYGDANVRILGQYGDPGLSGGGPRLSNGGERFALTGALGEPIMDFTYNDAWYPLTDGQGFSLVIRDENAEAGTWNLAESWRPSDLLLGSPGALDQGIAPDPGSILINEVSARRAAGDLVELFNPTSTAIPIGNFFFTDDVADSEKYRIPAGSVVPANGYLVLRDFEMNDRGGRLVLQAARADGERLGFQVTQRFNASDPNVSEGRYVNSAGNLDFTALESPTFPGSNAAPQIGPLAINEIMYNPVPGEQEFIELVNRSQTTLDLAGQRWRIFEGLDYAFPDGASVAAGGYALLVEGRTEADAASFRLAQGVPANVPIYLYDTALHGSLNNGGEDLTIGRQFDAESEEVIPVEQIEYDDLPPWPIGADGEGASIARLDLNQYGNDPLNWQTGRIGGTPGRANSFLDVTGPTTPGDLVGRIEGPAVVALAWTESVDPESGVDHYRIYRDGTPVGTSVVARYTDSEATFSPSGPLRYTVSAVNGDGIESEITPQAVSFSAESRSFQQGVRGYSSASDVEIRSGGGMSPETALNVDGSDGGGEAAALFQWQDLSIPAGSIVVGASITLSVFDAGDNYEFFQLEQSWDDDATWTSRGNGSNWQSPGASGRNDRGSSVGELDGSSTGSNTTLLNSRGVGMVRDWINSPDDNHGVILTNAGASTNGVDIDSVESSPASGRPELTVLYLPVPGASIPGDINLNGELDHPDLDILCHGVARSSSDTGLDLNLDGTVNQTDVTIWLTTAAIRNGVSPYTTGDANLDGRFDSGDLVQVFTAGGYEDQIVGNSRWSSGDWNCDGEFTTTDLILAFQEGSYVLGAGAPAAVALADPERLDLRLIAAQPLGREAATIHNRRGSDVESDVVAARLSKPRTLEAIDVVYQQDQVEWRMGPAEPTADLHAIDIHDLDTNIFVDELDGLRRGRV